MGGNGGPKGAGEELRLLVERAQRLRAEQKELKLDEKDVYNEAKGRGFDHKAVQRLVSYLEKDPDKRREAAAIDELYRSAIGVGDGSLSDMAREFVQGRRKGASDDQIDAFETPGTKGEPKPDVPTDFGDDLSDKPLTEDDAKRLGAEAAKAGRPVTANPFKAGDERRAAWDEAWCGALGSDGMDIPPELGPKPKPPKPPKGDKPDDGDDKKGGDE